MYTTKAAQFAQCIMAEMLQYRRTFRRCPSERDKKKTGWRQNEYPYCVFNSSFTCNTKNSWCRNKSDQLERNECSSELGAEKKATSGIIYLFLLSLVWKRCSLSSLQIKLCIDIWILVVLVPRDGEFKKKYYSEPCLHEMLTVFACRCPCLKLIIFNIISETRV